jgi:DNA-binding transcriptional MerR regulator
MARTLTGRGAVVAEEKLYSLTEMAESLGLAEPTARRYRDAFEEFLPSIGVGRRRKFTEPARQMLARIAALVHEQRMPVEVVRRILTSERTQADLNLAPLPAASADLREELRALREAVEALADQFASPESMNAGHLGNSPETDRLGPALLALRELITESVGVTLRQIERLQEAQEETRARLHQLSEDLFRRDEQAQLLMEATADIAARYEELAVGTTGANGKSRRLWRG